MPGTPTTKYGIPTMSGGDLARDIDTEVNAGLAAIDSKMAGYSEGTLAVRPTSTGGSPGVTGRIYRATDTGQVFIDTGTSWKEIGQAGGYAEVLTDQTASTGSGAIDLATVGPSVTVVVPTAGLVMLRAETTILGTVSAGGKVYVKEDAGTPFQILNAVSPESIPRTTVPGAAPAGNTGTTLGDGTKVMFGGWLVFAPTAGTHTYKLMYSGLSATNGGEHFKDRKLWVRAVAF